MGDYCRFQWTQHYFPSLVYTYGGDGLSNFGLPNLQGITIIGSGQGNNLSPYSFGTQTGSQQVTLTTNQMPAHTHSILNAPQFTGSTGGSQPFSNLQPSLVMNYIICISGNFPSSDSTGLKFPFIGQIAAYTGNIIPNGWALADGSLIPITQNTALFSVIGITYGGDGRSNFQLPDLRGRVAVGVATGSNTKLGGINGTESVTLLSTNLPSHQHNLLNNTYGTNQTGFTGAGEPFQNLQPLLGISYIIALRGIFPSADTGAVDPQAPILGEIVGFAGNYAPGGWAMADGSLLQISTNVAIFALLGTYFGGDGISTFALPDLRDRVIVGSGRGFNVADLVGSSAITLTTNQLPAHRHSLPN